MTGQSITQFAVHAGLIVLGISFLLTAWRVIKGPTLPDRVIALDMLVGIVMGFIALIAIRTGYTLYIDIAISLGLVGFLATVAFARFILSRKLRGGEDGSPPDPRPRSLPQPLPQATLAEPGPLASAPLGDPAAEPAPARPVLRKADQTKASAAKVKIAKAKAAGKAAVVAETAAAEGARKGRKPEAAAKPARTVKPATTATPAEPVQPAKTAKAVKPVKPARPAKPAKKETP